MNETIMPARSRYSSVAIWFHWIIAALVIANLAIAKLVEGAPKDVRGPWMGTHMAFGICVLVLTLGRIAWRIGHRPPPQPIAMRRWEVIASRTLHALFYILLVAVPLTGWIFTSGRGRGVDMFGLFTWPAFPVAEGKAAHDIGEFLHKNLGGLMLYLVILHILAALKHLFYDRDDLIARLNPFTAGTR